MHVIPAREARRIFSQLLDEAEHGAVISITRRGPVVPRYDGVSRCNQSEREADQPDHSRHAR